MSGSRPGPRGTGRSVNGEIARQRQIEIRRTAEQRGPLLEALASTGQRRPHEPVATRVALAGRRRTAGLLLAFGRVLGRLTRGAARSPGSS